MSLFFTCLFFPMISAIAIVKIHQFATYHPKSSCAFLRNVSLSNDASIQSCIWECVHENNCQTAVYFSDGKICSILIESCKPDGIQPSGNIHISVICYRTNQEPLNACSSTTTLNEVEEKETTISELIADIDGYSSEGFETVLATSSTTTTPIIITAVASQNTQLLLLNPGSVTSNTWIQDTYSYLATTSASLTLKFNFQANCHYNWYLDNVSLQDLTLTEMLTNGDFESASSLNGWTMTCSSFFCGSSCGLATSGCHASNKCYSDSCLLAASIQQSFVATTGQLYNLRFWIYRDHVSNCLLGLTNAEMNVIIS